MIPVQDGLKIRMSGLNVRMLLRQVGNCIQNPYLNACPPMLHGQQLSTSLCMSMADRLAADEYLLNAEEFYVLEWGKKAAEASAATEKRYRDMELKRKSTVL